MILKDTIIEGVKTLHPKIFGDKRGTFMELWNKKILKEIGIFDDFIQDNLSTSVKGTLRGVHTQLRYPQAKIVTCLKGEIFDVVVDCRRESTTFGKWHGELLSGENLKQIYIPSGVAHGFLTLSDAMVYMKVTTHYTFGDEVGFMWNDTTIGIEWPIKENETIILAEKDLQWKSFKEMVDEVYEARK